MQTTHFAKGTIEFEKVGACWVVDSKHTHEVGDTVNVWQKTTRTMSVVTITGIVGPLKNPEWTRYTIAK